MILLYRISTFLLYPILVIIIYWRTLVNKEDPYRFKEKIFSKNFNVNRDKNSKLIWFHSASIGEFKSILPIIRELNKRYNNLNFLVTTITLSSSKIANEEIKKFKNVQHRFFPLDIPFLIENFLSSWNPNLIFLVDSEIWPNLILNAKIKRIPIALINARITEKTYNKWKLISKTAKCIFGVFSLCLTSNKETAKYLNKFNARNIIYSGNIKLIKSDEKKSNINLNEKILVDNKFWLAVSTHRNEEKFCLETHIELKKKIKKIITLIVPRHINRVYEIEKICNQLNLSSQILNRDQKILNDKEVIIINSFGVLADYYKYSKSVLIGKSLEKRFISDGGQNPIDAAYSGCKVYHGPFVSNFEEIYQIFAEHNISKIVHSPKELAENLEIDINNYSKDNQNFSNLLKELSHKTLQDVMKNIDLFLLNEIK